MSNGFFNNIPFTGGGGGDLNNKGWFATPLALRTAYPIGQNGWHAIVGSTDTVWVWDTDTNDWVDTQTARSVTSVFGRTGNIEAESGDYNASQVDYDNSTSGLDAENVQDAIDEVVADITAVRNDIQDFLQPIEVPFTNTTTVTVTHNLSRKPIIQALDSNNAIINSAYIRHTSINEFVMENTVSSTGIILYY